MPLALQFTGITGAATELSGDVGLRPGQRLWLDAPQLIIGRSEHADLRIRSPFIARYHARCTIITTARGTRQHWLEDLSSSNSTYLHPTDDAEPLPAWRTGPLLLEPGMHVSLAQMYHFIVVDPA